MIVGDAAFAKRVEGMQSILGAEFADATRAAGGRGESIAIAGGHAAFAGTDSPLTQAIGVAIGEAAGEGALDAIEEFYFTRGAPSSIHATAWTDPALVAEMGKRGYRILEFENVFARTLADSDVDSKPANGIRIEVVSQAEHATFIRVGAEGFATEEMSAEFLMDIMAPFVHLRSARCYLAYLDGEPAGTAAAVFGNDGVVGLFGAGTLPRFRHRGIQTALVQRRLADGIAQGAELAIVTTAPGSASHRNVARRGFELAYMKVNLRREVPR